METQASHHDYFSSLIIHQSDFQNEIILPHQKLKAIRNGKGIIQDGSSINESRFKLIVKYDGYFKPVSNGTKRKYCFGRRKTIYLDILSFGFEELLGEVNGLYSLDENPELSMYFLDQQASTQLFVQVEDDESYNLMLTKHEEKRKAMIYVTKEQIDIGSREGGSLAENLENHNTEFENYEEESDYCHSEDSYHSRHSDIEDEDEDETNIGYEGEFYSYDKDDPKMEVNAMFPHVTAFRKALSHYAVLNDFEYKLIKSDQTRVTARCVDLNCNWRIHASVAQDNLTFVVKTIKPSHSCCGVNKGGNKHATSGWVADRITDDLKKELDISARELKKRLQEKYGVPLPYHRVWEGKELAIEEIFGKWDNYFTQIGALKSLHLYDVEKSTDSCAEVQKAELVWTVNLDEQKCSCRAWQVRGIPCAHAAAFIASQRNAKWKNYVHSYFTVDRFKMAYAIGIAPMPSRNEWVEVDLGYKMLPPTLKRPAGRPRKNRIKASDEPKKKSHKCTRCGQYGHHKTTCRNAVPSQESEGAPQAHKTKSKRGVNGVNIRSKKRACPPNIFRILQEEEN